MKLLEVDGVPCQLEQKASTRADTAHKIYNLQAHNEDFEWYPTDYKILQAMSRDLFNEAKWRGCGSRHYGRENWFHYDSRWYDREKDEHFEQILIDSFLDVGAGDGRVFSAVESEKKGFVLKIHRRYGIEKARQQADDLIRNDVFIIGRDFGQITLVDKTFSVIFSNPPYSIFVDWTQKLLKESNFGIMYLVLPLRWKNQEEITDELKRFDYKVLGEYDFTEADRKARARVNLIRVTHKTAVVDGKEYETEEEDAFVQWIHEHIGVFGTAEKSEYERERDEMTALKIKGDNIDDLLENYQYEMDNLLEAFKFLPRLPERLFEAFGINKDSAIEVIRKEVASLKTRHWKIAFSKLDAINSRLTRDTRETLLGKMAEFKTLDFNRDNIYSIIIWVIQNFNKYIPMQIVALFEKFTEPDYIKEYKSNRHWNKDTWRYNRGAKVRNEFVGAEGKGKPERYKLDYRIVAKYGFYTYSYSSSQSSLIDDVMVICRNLGYWISENCHADYEAIGEEQFFEFNTTDKEGNPYCDTAFSARLFQNGNAHFKFNKELLLKFNVEVARLKGWLRGPKDIQDEFDLSESEAVKLWTRPALCLLGNADLKMLEMKEAC